MDLRLGLYELAATHRLDAASSEALARLAGLGEEPPALRRTLPRGVAVLGAALVGLGTIFWIAANWDTLGRLGRFGLLQAVVLVMCLGALARTSGRVPLGLMALLAIGALFAFFGQTYQTGADPWQLFALWAALALPLCLGVRSDVLWAPWTLVAMTAISLWVFAHVGHRWWPEPEDLLVHLLGWGAALVVVGALATPSRRVTGAGDWALRTALTLAVLMITATALGGLFGSQVAPHYGLALAALAVLGIVFALPRSFDVYGLSAVALGLITLLVAGLAWRLFDRGGADPIMPLLVLGLVAAGLLAACVAGVLRLARRQGVRS